MLDQPMYNQNLKVAVLLQHLGLFAVEKAKLKASASKQRIFATLRTGCSFVFLA